jgi:HipA-like kinase
MRPLLTKFVRTLHGGSQPHLMMADDGNYCIVKFQGNPQGTNVLVNEMLAAKLLEWLGLSAAATTVVELQPPLNEELYFETPSGRQPILPGLHFGVEARYEHDAWALIRFPTAELSASYQEPAGFSWHSAFRPVDLQSRRTAGRLLEIRLAEEVHCHIY